MQSILTTSSTSQPPKSGLFTSAGDGQIWKLIHHIKLPSYVTRVCGSDWRRATDFFKFKNSVFEESRKRCLRCHVAASPASLNPSSSHGCSACLRSPHFAPSFSLCNPSRRPCSTEAVHNGFYIRLLVGMLMRGTTVLRAQHSHPHSSVAAQPR